jgi:23S rRNA (adenine2503-C2)-methyltransferase
VFDEVKFNLAISLHTASDSKRDILMALNKKVKLADLRKSISYFYDKTGSRVTYEYILFKDLNDNIEDAQKLVQFAKVSPCKINLIEYNKVAGVDYEKASNKSTENFMSYLEEKNIIVNLRKSKGKDIAAACGQLVNKLQ